MSAIQSAPSLHIVIAGAGPAAQALVRRIAGGSDSRQRAFHGTITVLSNRDECPEALLELAELPQVSVRFGQAASFIDADAKMVTTVDGMEFSYDQLVIATGSAPALPPVPGAESGLSYSTIDDAASIGEAVKDVTRLVGRRPLGILVGNGPAAGQAEAVLRARGVRPVRTTLRPTAVVPFSATESGAGTGTDNAVQGTALPATGIVFEDGSSMKGDLVILAEERTARNDLAESAGLTTSPDGGISVGRDLATSVPGIWAIGDAASCDGLRLGLLLSAESSAMLCASGLLLSAGKEDEPALMAA
ncbi:FAD-dependent oxidoreductase [Paenarthrobacter aurescens]|uniref:FAD/NAD(P)-binding domain-containing protein n=1 Tax=Paenarthrobacter aurescens TaxID=43663 RepID=A0A4Y3NKJ3_PAEAU|nr:FAD-dependent oxidoreductase [Paenarthrobacter aurescens]UKA51161.1 FAD-dependent oxidoreductase [Arthrobacter sp. FW305-123]MDO6142910.1 FAD-dependent oxidoreductase [Paenarthrobacter aurescens]MDO6146755.1 FAD-dependent oxidoreductase [Paenarthrobacter aurescens]MDO6158001.1 FAD-dependent oxidoreductase [Paenarthrobacter aurescens]MDO6161986.1 FAD-dependent oxidoreductase [Paenarthrobacter aurescens]